MRPTAVSLFALVSAALVGTAHAQRPRPAQPEPRQPDRPAEQAAVSSDTGQRPSERAGPPREKLSVTEHSIRIGGQTIAYRATVATILIRNDSDEAIGSLEYTAYTRTDAGDPSRRPIAFIYNGGPGSASMWLHMGAYGPRRIVTTDAGYTPPAPYQIVDNENSLIDVTDMVFIDPIGTGFSTPVGKGKGRDFWGVDEDSRSLTQFIYTYVSRNHRWNSPKFLIGESYGTTRSAVLVNRLQSAENMNFNGVVLMSSVLDFETLEFAPGHDISYALYLPTYAATAAYHHVIPQPANLAAWLDTARTWAMGPYLSALNKGAALPAAERAAVLQRLAAYTGLSQDYLNRADLRVTLGEFNQELSRSQGFVTGRLDSRFQGPEFDLLAQRSEYDPQSLAVSSAFTTAINSYLRDELRFPAGDQRYVSGGVARPWNWNREPGGQGAPTGFPGAPYVGGDLANALVRNPNLRVEVENGLYDSATPFFATEYTMDHLGVNAELRSHVTMKYYDAGHMMYLLPAAMAQLKANVASFIQANSRTP